MFIRDGRFDFLTMLDRDSCISYDTKTKLESLHVREKLMDMMKERRKDIEMFGRQKNVNLRQIETKAGNAKQGNDSLKKKFKCRFRVEKIRKYSGGKADYLFKK